MLHIMGVLYLKHTTDDLDLLLKLYLCVYVIAGVGIGGEEQNISVVSLFRLPWLVLSVSILFVGIMLCIPVNHINILFL